MNKHQAGSRGGRATVRKHGKDHMQAIGRKGAKAFWARYHLAPVGTSAWAIVNRETGKVINTIGAPAWMRRIVK